MNIIAHSKGGLDARYTITKKQMGHHVASLTTISTPHHGCNFVDVLIRIVPDGFYRKVAQVFDHVFHNMGDSKPDFYTLISFQQSGLIVLTKKSRMIQGYMIKAI